MFEIWHCYFLSRPDKSLFSLTFSVAPAEPLLCKFADGGQKKRQTQVKYPQNGRPWTREGEVRLENEDYLSNTQESSLSGARALFLRTKENIL